MMWFKSRKRKARERRADLDRLRATVTQEVTAQVRDLLSLSRVDELGQPNLMALNAAISNLSLANLTLKYFGYELARQLAAALPLREGTSARHVGLQSKLSTQEDMESDWIAHWCAQMLVPVVMHRKLWELAYVLQAIHEHGHMREGARGLGFGCGEEAIPSYLASRGVKITVTDLKPEEAEAAGWIGTHQHVRSLDSAFRPSMVDRATFDRLVDFEVVDMNAIPVALGDYDFCWSICALEHLGSIANGLTFIEQSLRTLCPGGLAVHTTEFNIAPDGPTVDNWPTVLFQRHHMVRLAEELRAQGHVVAELNFDLGDKPMDRFIDLPPWGHDLPDELTAWYGHSAHLKVALDGFACTCFGIIVRRAERDGGAKLIETT